MARLQSTPAVFGSMERAYKARLQFWEYGARLQSTPAVFREYGARLQSTPAVGVCQQVSAGMARLQSTPAVRYASR